MSTTEITRRINMYGGSPLNRLSWLRTSHTFLNLIIAQPSTRWLVFNAGQPLVCISSGPNESKSKPVPAYLSTEDLKPLLLLLGAWPYFGQGREAGKLVSDEDSEKASAGAVEAARHRGVPLVFLGVHETKAQPMEEDSTTMADTTSDPYAGLGDGTHTIAVPLDDFKKPGVDPEQLVNKIVRDGTPYFATDVGDLLAAGEINEEGLQEIFKKSKGGEGKVFSWSEPRSLLLHLNYFNAAIFAVARSMVDWNYRNKFCPGCGAKAYSLWGGWKIACSTLLPWVDSTGKKPCPSGIA